MNSELKQYIAKYKSLSERRRNNYYPEIYNFFNINFSKYAQRNP
jgi:hypothetical protein